MNQINFIPNSYFRARALRRSLIRHAVVVVIGVLLMGGWYTTARKEVLSLDWELTALAQQALVVEEEAQRQAVDRVQRLASSKQARARDRLKTAVPTTSIMALIAELMPPSMGLKSLTLLGEPVNPAPIQKKKPRPAKKASQAQTVKPLRLLLEGFAPNDLTIATFIGRLDKRPLFDNVELAFSRPVRREALLAREFQITAEIPLNRSYLLESGQKVLLAD